MLKPITFRVTLPDGSGVNVTASAPDYVSYEQEFNKSVVLGMQNGMWSCYMYVIWHAMFRQGLTALSWADWLDSSPEFDAELKSEEPVPLDQTAPLGSSPDSQ